MTPWNAFLASIAEAKHEVKCDRNGAWFRGLGRRSYTLVPKLLRQRGKAGAEQNIYKAYLRTRMASTSTNSWNHLVDMQHYGTATRLLDWTECFAVALFFAIGQSRYDAADPPTIWVLNPFSLACRARGDNNRAIGDFHIDPDFSYYKHFIQASTWLYEFPFPFYSPAPNERIRAQRGFFTIHGKSEKPLENTCRRHAVAVTIPEDVLPEAREFLKLSGIDEEFLYPDQEGWLNKVQRDYFYSANDPGT